MGVLTKTAGGGDRNYGADIGFDQQACGGADISFDQNAGGRWWGSIVPEANGGSRVMFALVVGW